MSRRVRNVGACTDEDPRDVKRARYRRIAEFLTETERATMSGALRFSAFQYDRDADLVRSECPPMAARFNDQARTCREIAVEIEDA